MTTKYVFDITEPNDGEFWHSLIGSGAAVTGRRLPNGFFEITAVVPDGARVKYFPWASNADDPACNVSFAEWLTDVMGCPAEDMVEQEKK